MILLGVLIAVTITSLPPAVQSNSPLFLTISGAIAICAMLLPGISGAYILVLLGAYETMLETFKEVTKFNSDYFLKFISFSLGAILSIKFFVSIKIAGVIISFGKQSKLKLIIFKNYLYLYFRNIII